MGFARLATSTGLAEAVAARAATRHVSWESMVDGGFLVLAGFRGTE